MPEITLTGCHLRSYGFLSYELVFDLRTFLDLTSVFLCNSPSMQVRSKDSGLLFRALHPPSLGSHLIIPDSQMSLASGFCASFL